MDAEDLEPEALRIAQEIIRKVPGSVASTKRLMREDLNEWRRKLERQKEAFVTLVQQPENRQFVEQFVAGMEKSRQPGEQVESQED